MALRPQFEPLRGAILHRSPLPTVDGAVHERRGNEVLSFVASPAQSVFVTPAASPGLVSI